MSLLFVLGSCKKDEPKEETKAPFVGKKYLLYDEKRNDNFTLSFSDSRANLVYLVDENQGESLFRYVFDYAYYFRSKERIVKLFNPSVRKSLQDKKTGKFVKQLELDEISEQMSKYIILSPDYTIALSSFEIGSSDTEVYIQEGKKYSKDVLREKVKELSKELKDYVEKHSYDKLFEAL